MPRTKPAEAKTFKRTCPICGKPFTTDNARTKYDTPECKKIANNAAYYQQHADTVSSRNNERQKQQRQRLMELEATQTNK